jgi:hypothetical protein
MPWRFEDCRQRIGRAEAHREALAKAWNHAAKEDLYSVIVRMEDDGAGAIFLNPTYGPDFTNSISLQLGEMLYQLRAALDRCIYQARIAESHRNPPPNEQYLEFPICFSDSAEFGKKAASMLGPLAEKRRAIVESVQPYNIPKDIEPQLMVFNFNRTLGILHNWARFDRHRKLHVVGSWVSNANPAVRCPDGTTLEYLRVGGSGFLEDESQIASFRVVGYRRGMTVQANPDVDIDIAVNEIPPPCANNDTLGNRLRAMFIATYTIVGSFEDSF